MHNEKKKNGRTNEHCVRIYALMRPYTYYYTHITHTCNIFGRPRATG